MNSLSGLEYEQRGAGFTGCDALDQAEITQAPPDGSQQLAPTAHAEEAQARLRNARVVGSWIVLPDGSQVGVATVRGVKQPAPPFDEDTKKATVDGNTVTVTEVEPKS